MKKFLIAVALIALPAAAQTDWFNAQLEMRTDYTLTTIGSDKTNSGFKCQYVNVKLNGDISSKFSYSYRQRFSKDMLRNGGYLDATDYMFLSFHPNERWNFSAGKQFVAIGGYEYDYAPIDVYQYTEFCNNIYCYGYGASIDYNVTPNDNLLVQAAQSAFADHSRDYYSYNLRWAGHHGCFSSIYSINMQEYAKHKYINVIALGNRFDFSHGHFIADFTNRYAKVNGAKFFGDFTAMTELHVQPIRELNVFAHYSFDRNGHNEADITVRPGTKLNSIGAGVEYFPLKGENDVRLHLSYFHNWGQNGNTSYGVLQDNQNYLTAGLTWRVNWKKIKQRIQEKK